MQDRLMLPLDVFLSGAEMVKSGPADPTDRRIFRWSGMDVTIDPKNNQMSFAGGESADLANSSFVWEDQLFLASSLLEDMLDLKIELSENQRSLTI